MESTRASQRRGDIRSGAMLAALAWLLSLAGCNTDPEGALVASVANEFATEAGLLARIEPGAILDRDASAPFVWAAHPNPTLVFRASTDDPPPTTFRLGNLAVGAEVTIRSAAVFDVRDDAACSDDPARTIDCSTEDDPLCQSTNFQPSDDTATRATIEADLAPCTEIRIEIGADRRTQQTLDLALIGPTRQPGPIPDLARAAAAAQADVLVLTGDHAERSSLEALDSLSGRMRTLPIPVVLTPGEREVVDGGLSAFRERFGNPALDWETRLSTGVIQFTTIRTPNQSLGNDGVTELSDRLTTLDRNNPVVALTHTPPFDPQSLRDRGFRSRIEAGRALSVMGEEEVDLLVAGHLPTDHQTSQEGLPLRVPGESEDGRFMILELQASPSMQDAQLEFETRFATTP